MNSQDVLTFDKQVFPAQFYLQVKEGMARFDVPGAENLKTLLGYCEAQGYRVEWTGSVERESELGVELASFPGGRYVAHRLPGQVLDPTWAPPKELAGEAEAAEEVVPA